MKNIQFLNKKQNSKKGFALTEVLLAIAVIVIIGIAAYPLYKNARTSSEVEAMANDIAIIQTNTQTLYSGQSSYTGIALDQMDKAGLVPDDMKPLAGANGVNAWGGVVTIGPNTGTAVLPANAGFSIGITNIPQSACTQLINRVAPSFIGIGTGNGTAEVKGTAAAGPPVVTATQVNIAAIPAACPSTGGTLYFTAR